MGIWTGWIAERQMTELETSRMSIRVLVPLADGVEEMEAVILIDTLRRAGIEAVGAGLHGLEITGSRGVVLQADTLLQELLNQDPCGAGFHAIAIPGGGPGTDACCEDDRLIELVRDMHAAGKWIAAICAAPKVLLKAGVLEGRAATCHPGVADQMGGMTLSTDRVVVDGPIVTSRGPGTGFDFALRLIELLDSPAKAASVAGPMCL